MNYPTAKEMKEKSIVGAALQKEKHLQELFAQICVTASTGGTAIQVVYRLEEDVVNLLHSLGYTVTYLTTAYNQYTTIRWNS